MGGIHSVIHRRRLRSHAKRLVRAIESSDYNAFTSLLENVAAEDQTLLVRTDCRHPKTVTQTSWGSEPLICTCVWQPRVNMAILRYLLDTGAGKTCEGDDIVGALDLLLTVCVLNEQGRAVSLLVRRGADVNGPRVTALGETLLDVACGFAYTTSPPLPRMCQLLLSMGAEKEGRFDKLLLQTRMRQQSSPPDVEQVAGVEGMMSCALAIYMDDHELLSQENLDRLLRRSFGERLWVKGNAYGCGHKPLITRTIGFLLARGARMVQENGVYACDDAMEELSESSGSEYLGNGELVDMYIEMITPSAQTNHMSLQDVAVDVGRFISKRFGARHITKNNSDGHTTGERSDGVGGDGGGGGNGDGHGDYETDTEGDALYECSENDASARGEEIIELIRDARDIFERRRRHHLSKTDSNRHGDGQDGTVRTPSDVDVDVYTYDPGTFDQCANDFVAVS
eukprot:GFYU01032676.1.p1 GENE.GFYU01032676.1~~GFYU01032676.1.p1  ORF type:complete len:454 (+),score=64.88 GFYU01032676.1:73-1434(+)